MGGVRRGELIAGLLMGVAVLLPLLVYGPIDQEELSLGIFSTQVHYEHLRQGQWLLWFDGLGFGTPLPLGHRLDAHPAFALLSGVSLRAALSAVWLTQISLAVVYFLRLHALSSVRAPLRLVLLGCYLGSVPTICWLYLNDWVTFVIGWTLFPALLFYLRRTLLEPRGRPWEGAVPLAIVFGFLVVNSHPGYIAPLAISLGAYTLGVAPRSRRVYATLAVGFVLCVAVSAERLYYFASEMALFPAEVRRESQGPYPVVEHGRALVSPLAGADRRLRLPFVGAAIVVSAAVGLMLGSWRRDRHLRGCGIALGVAFALSLTPNTALSWTASSGSWLFRDALLLFGFLLGGATLQRWLDQPSPLVRRLTWGLLAVQVVQQLLVLRPALQHYDTYKASLDFYRSQGTPVGLGRVLVEAASSYGPRLYLSQEAERAVRGQMSRDGIYGSTDLSLIGLAPVNGWFKSTSMDRLYPSNALMHGFIGGESDVLGNDTLLDALGIDLILMAEGEATTSPHLELVARHSTEIGDRRRTFVVMGNPAAWPRASLVGPEARSMTLPARPSCSRGFALCRDYQPLADARVGGDVTIAGEHGRYRVNVPPAERERVIFFSMLYRPEWRATASTSQLRVDPIADAFVGITVPPRVTEIELEFAPAPRVVLAWMSGITWLLLVGSGVFLHLRRPENRAA